MAYKRQKDPTRVPVQLNVNVPWQLREDLIEIASEKRTSLTALVTEACNRHYRDEITLLVRRRTSEVKK